MKFVVKNFDSINCITGDVTEIETLHWTIWVKYFRSEFRVFWCVLCSTCTVAFLRSWFFFYTVSIFFTLTVYAYSICLFSLLFVFLLCLQSHSQPECMSSATQIYILWRNKFCLLSHQPKEIKNTLLCKFILYHIKKLFYLPEGIATPTLASIAWREGSESPNLNPH
jgi:hypothetical protein